TDEKLQREIAYWMATQFMAPSKDKFVGELSPNDMLAKIQAAFQGGSSGEQYTIGMFKTDMGKRAGGHALTPYAIMESGDTTKLMVYDNNFPNEERSIEIDKKANTWKYNAAINPTVPAELYQGDASTKSLLLAPV